MGLQSVRKQERARVCCFAILLSWLSVALQAQAISPVIFVNHGPNAPRQLSKPYVVLVSLDGFRYDYAKRYHAKNIMDLAARGTTAPEGMIPSYPSITFPNHYTIVTGLYPEHHGIVANSFYDPARKEVYDFHDSNSVTDGTWYGGTPLWVLAEQQGMRSASFFWVGSEADIQGTRPTYYLKYDEKFPNPKRVDRVLAWLRLPPEQRPHFVTLYFSETDSAGHRYGPDSREVADAVHDVDEQIGRLVAGLQQLNLPVDLIVLADHGMANVEDGIVQLDEYGLKTADFEKIIGLNLYPKTEADAESAYETLRGKSSRFLVYRRADVPARLHFNTNPRAGDPIVVATGPYFIRVGTDPERPQRVPAGAHGYDAERVPDMKALFVAAGPDIRSGMTVASFENVDVYPFVARILGLDVTHLTTGPIDGKLEVLGSALKGERKTQ